MPGAQVVEEVCDVSDLDAVRDWTADLADRIPALNGLVHNAVVMPRAAAHPAGPRGATGHQRAGVPHLITERLLPLLRLRRASVVFMSSGGMYSAPLVVDDMEPAGLQRRARLRPDQADAGGAGRLVGPPVGRHGHPGGSMHPAGGDPGVAEYLPGSGPSQSRCCATSSTAPTRRRLVATRPPSKPGRFWHDRSQRPTTFGWQRSEDPAKVRRFLEQVSRLTGTTAAWTGLRA